MDEQKTKISQEVQKFASDLRLSSIDAPEHLIQLFSTTALFEVAKGYINNPTIGQREWLIYLELLCFIDVEKANPILSDALNHKNAGCRYQILRKLSREGNSTIIPKLLEILKTEPDPSLRYLIALTLGKLKAKRAIPTLEWLIENDAALNYEDIPVSRAAREALDEINKAE